MISSSNSLSRGSGMLHQVDDAFTARHVRHRAVPRTNRTPATSSRAYQSKSARVERAGIVMQSCGFRPNSTLPVTAFYKGESQGKRFPGDWKERTCSLSSPAQVTLRGSGVFPFWQIHVAVVDDAFGFVTQTSRVVGWVNHGSI
jgi:hypothetical protein